MIIHHHIQWARMTKMIQDFEAKDTLEAEFTKEGTDPQSLGVVALGTHSIVGATTVASR